VAPREKRAFLWGVAASVVFHALLFIAFPLLRDAAARRFVEPPGVVTARLVERAPLVAEEPPPPPQPAAQEPRKEPPRPAPAARAKPKPKPAPRPERPVPQAEPVVPSPPASAAEASAPPTSAPPTTAPAPPVEPGATSEARAPAVPAPTGGRDEEPDVSLLVSRFRIALMRQIERDLQPQYRRLIRYHAALGKGEIFLAFGEAGAMTELRMARSTGDAILDQASLESVKRSKERVAIPPGLHGRRFTLRIPVEFNLNED
jgi:protein TonB